MTITMKIRTYSELITLDSFEDRFEYLRLSGRVGQATFGYERYLNQVLYKSQEWKRTRNQIILRDNACDLAMPGYEIFDKRFVIIHHMNPITIEQIENRDPMIFDPDLLITTILKTHNAIHYGNDPIVTKPIERKPNDTCPWK